MAEKTTGTSCFIPFRQKNWEASQKCRKKIEKIFGWIKYVGRSGRSRFVGRWKTKLYFLMTGVTYNLLRLVNLGIEWPELAR